MLGLLYSIPRHLLWVPRVRKWHDKMHSPGKILGTPASDEKLWRQFTRSIRLALEMYLNPLTRLYRNNTWVKLRTCGTRVRINHIHPVKPKKKFIITLTRLPQSVQVAKRCIESARRHDEHHGLEIFPAVSKFEALDFFIRHGLSWYQLEENINRKKNPLSEMGCFASHYMLWKRCVEIAEPIIILEHDTMFLSPIPSLKFKHVISLAQALYMPPRIRVGAIKQPRPREVFHPMRRLDTGHCYAITPEGANLLLRAAKHRLVLPADAFIQKELLDILHYRPPLVGFDYKFSTIDKRDSGCMSPEETWKNFKPDPEPCED